MSYKSVLIASIAGCLLGGCATIVNGTSQDYQIRSDPEGAVATLSNGQSCTTPCEISLKRRHDQRVDFELDGYQSSYVLVQSRTGGAFAGNLLATGIIGGAIDGANGASNHLYPRPLTIRLVPNGGAGEAVLLDQKGAELATVAAHNAKVRDDLRESLGADAVGDNEPSEATARPGTR